MGACRRQGEVRCSNGEYVEVCAPGTPLDAADTTCDGVDDDCDGALDEDYRPARVVCGLGVCARAVEPACANGALVGECEPGTPRGPDDNCDGFDDDCDGEADEDYREEAVFCGVGSCQREGRRRCVGGVPVEECDAPEPAPEVCDGEDNDCDFEVDEGPILTLNPVRITAGADTYGLRIAADDRWLGLLYRGGDRWGEEEGLLHVNLYDDPSMLIRLPPTGWSGCQQLS